MLPATNVSVGRPRKTTVSVFIAVWSFGHICPNLTEIKTHIEAGHLAVSMSIGHTITRRTIEAFITHLCTCFMYDRDPHRQISAEQVCTKHIRYP